MKKWINENIRPITWFFITGIAGITGIFIIGIIAEIIYYYFGA